MQETHTAIQVIYGTAEREIKLFGEFNLLLIND